MKLDIKRLGPLEDTSFEWKEGLTLFVGANQTGKTYLSTLLYGVLSGGGMTFPDSFSRLILDEILKNGSFSMSFEEWEYNLNKYICEDSNDYLKKNFYTYFGLEMETMSDWEVLLKALNYRYDFNHVSKTEYFNRIELQVKKNKYEIPISIDNDTITLILNEKVTKHDYDMIIREMSARLNYFLIAYGSNFECAERAGINLLAPKFQKYELSYYKNDVYSDIEYQRRQNNYSFPIEHALEIFGYRADRLTPTKFFDLVHKYEQQMLKGKILFHPDSEWEFRPEFSDQVLPLRGTASGVKAMASVFYYLKYYVNKGDILFIDEPEINLHGDNQRIFVRMIAHLVNEGLNVVMATHSLIILQELNNLIMLGKAEQKKETEKDNPEWNETLEAVYKTYKFDKAQALPEGKIHGHLFKRKAEDNPNCTIEPLEVNDAGWDVENIMSSINEMSHASHDLFYGLIANDKYETELYVGHND